MARLVFSGMLDKLPTMKIITHHCGAMAPFFDARIELGMAQMGARTADEDYGALLKSLARRPLDYFKMFYGDTAVNGSASAIRCGLDFFGNKHVLFGTDCPFDPEGGPMFIREGIRAINSLKLSDADLRKLYYANAIDMLRLDLSAPAIRKGKPAARVKKRKR